MQRVSVGMRPVIGDWIGDVTTAYLLPARHPAADGRHEDGAEQDLSRVVDQQRD